MPSLHPALRPVRPGKGRPGFRFAALVSIAAAVAGPPAMAAPEVSPRAPAASAARNEPAGEALSALQAWLARPRAGRPSLADQPFATTPLTREEASRAKSLLWDEHAAWIRETRAAEMKDRRLEHEGRVLRFDWRHTGPKPEGGYPLFLSLHGGGGAPAEVNDSQWANQLRLGDAYRPQNAIYVAPRAPTNTWNLWHEAHIDPLFDRLIENFVVLEDVNPDRVYLLGYSAGGDGVYQVAPRFADRLAAAAMMAGHPNEASPLGLRNIGFALHMGALDAAYRRNEIAREWGVQLAALRAADPGGYAHQVEIHEGKSHWMELEDRRAIPWMEQFTRNPWPRTVVWKQDDVIHPRLYWLAVDPAQARAGDELRARLEGTRIELHASRPLAVSLLLDDALIDLDQPLTVTAPDGQRLFSGPVVRTIATLHQTLATRGQRAQMAAARLELPATPAVR